ncbi:MAG: group III truncated hemoglobin [Rhizobiaceae bacterium]
MTQKIKIATAGEARKIISEKQISDLVDRFYELVRGNELLGPIFQRHIDENWERHLDKMKTFWRSVLLKTGEYKGKPVPVHLKIDGIGTREFEEWLSLFAATASKIFEPDAAELVIQAGNRIATSLWLSRSSDPFASPPDWSCKNHRAA